VYCSSEHSCLAVDGEGDVVSGDPTAGAGGWTTSEKVASDFTGLSCAPGICAAYVFPSQIWTSTGGPGLTETEGLCTPGFCSLDALSCASSALCLGFSGNKFFWSQKPTTKSWMETENVVPDNGSRATAVSCLSEEKCAVVDDASPQGGDVFISRGLPIDPGEDVEGQKIDPESPLEHIDCLANEFCLALDAAGRALVTNDLYAFPQEHNWSAPETVDTAGTVSSISCASSTFCAVVDETGHVAVYATEHTEVDKSKEPEGTKEETKTPGQTGTTGSTGGSGSSGGSSGSSGGSTGTVSSASTTPGTGSAGHAKTSGTTAETPLACVAGVCFINVTLYVTEVGAGAASTKKGRKPKTKQVVVGVKSVTLDAGQHETVKITLNATGRRLLAVRHRLAVSLRVSERAAGGTMKQISSQSITFKAAKKG
jgi:hypothetical protein